MFRCNRRWMLATWLALWGAGAFALSGDPSAGIWTSAAELAERSMAGAAWEAVLAAANEPIGNPNISDINDDSDVRAMAKALVYARTGIQQYKAEAVQMCIMARETENDGNALALSRNLIGYVIAADLVEMPQNADSLFRAWLEDVRHEDLLGRTLISTHEERPNNWGTHAGASRAAVAIYLGDAEDLAAAVNVFKGWLGDRDAYSGFEYGELWWQANSGEPVGINPAGSTIQGHSVDGVLPDDQRRAGPFQWPPPQENYVYEALQGAVALAVILDRQGYDVWNWEDAALLRAFKWLHIEANYPAPGDDTWQPHLINWYYQSCFPAPAPSQPGKNVGYADWTHGVCTADFDGDGVVGTADLLALLFTWADQNDCVTDLNGDGFITTADLLQLLSHWGPCF